MFDFKIAYFEIVNIFWISPFFCLKLKSLMCFEPLNSNCKPLKYPMHFNCGNITYLPVFASICLKLNVKISLSLRIEVVRILNIFYYYYFCLKIDLFV